MCDPIRTVGELNAFVRSHARRANELRDGWPVVYFSRLNALTAKIEEYQIQMREVECSYWGLPSDVMLSPDQQKEAGELAAELEKHIKREDALPAYTAQSL